MDDPSAEGLRNQRGLSRHLLRVLDRMARLGSGHVLVLLILFGFEFRQEVRGHEGFFLRVRVAVDLRDGRGDDGMPEVRSLLAERLQLIVRHPLR
jgi:hypothetical protein